MTDFMNVNEKAARKLQLAMLNAVYKQIQADPLAVSASLLAVAERLLARWSMGLEDFGNKGEMTKDEKEMMAEFENLKLELDSDLFDTP